MTEHPIEKAERAVRVTTWKYGVVIALHGLRQEGWTDKAILSLVNDQLRELSERPVVMDEAREEREELAALEAEVEDLRREQEAEQRYWAQHPELGPWSSDE